MIFPSRVDIASTCCLICTAKEGDVTFSILSNVNCTSWKDKTVMMSEICLSEREHESIEGI